jgi:hypothetical protein
MIEIHKTLVSDFIAKANENGVHHPLQSGKSFDQAYRDSVQAQIDGLALMKYHVINFEDLITSKIKSGREQDLRDVYMLQKIRQS